MKKIVISKLFLYKHRFIIGYILLFLAFTGLVFLMPLISPAGLSSAEMESVVASEGVSTSSILQGEVIDLPYHAIQKAFIRVFGLSPYVIKLPSIIIGFFLGILLILLLNRWFKNNVALLASILTVLSAPFLYVAGSGTPLIMLIFWPTLLLWLGSKIQGKVLKKTFYAYIFGFTLLLSSFTPYMAYLTIFIVLYALAHPHLRFMIKSLPKIPFALASVAVITGFGYIGYGVLMNPEVATKLLFMEDFSLHNFFGNIKDALLPFFSWSGNIEGTFLSPMIGLASLALAITGLISTANGFFASRNSIASLLLLFTLFLSGMAPESVVLIILPFAILTAHAIRYILEKWYGLFPENPYARIFGLVPITTFLALIIFSSLSHFIFGYRYSPAVAPYFKEDLSLIYEYTDSNSTILIEGGTLEYDFYKVLEKYTDYHVTSVISEIETEKVITIGKWNTELPFELGRIITSPKSSNSDRIYLYTVN